MRILLELEMMTRGLGHRSLWHLQARLRSAEAGLAVQTRILCVWLGFCKGPDVWGSGSSPDPCERANPPAPPPLTPSPPRSARRCEDRSARVLAAELPGRLKVGLGIPAGAHGVPLREAAGAELRNQGGMASPPAWTIYPEPTPCY